MSWTDAENNAVLKGLAVALELTGTDWSALAVKAAAKALEAYPAAQITGSLNRCASECKFKLTLADIVSRLDDGRPGPEEAWAMFPKDEQDAAVVTEEMSVAWGVASKLYDSDPIAARMAFKESYFEAVREARLHGHPAKWRLTPGLNKALTESVAVEAVKAGKLPPAAIEAYVLPEHRPVGTILRALTAPLAYAPRQLEANKKRLASVLARINGEPAQAEHNPIPWNEVAEK